MLFDFLILWRAPHFGFVWAPVCSPVCSPRLQPWSGAPKRWWASGCLSVAPNLGPSIFDEKTVDAPQCLLFRSCWDPGYLSTWRCRVGKRRCWEEMWVIMVIWYDLIFLVAPWGRKNGCLTAHSCIEYWAWGKSSLWQRLLITCSGNDILPVLPDQGHDSDSAFSVCMQN